MLQYGQTDNLRPIQCKIHWNQDTGKEGVYWGIAAQKYQSNFCREPVEASLKYFSGGFGKRRQKNKEEIGKSIQLSSRTSTALMVKENVKLLRTPWTEREAFWGVRWLRERSSLNRPLAGTTFTALPPENYLLSRTVCFLPKCLLPWATLKGQGEALEQHFHTGC